MADTTTRVDDVTANIEACEDKYSDENYNRLISVCLKDISISLAMLVDAGTQS